MRVLVLWAAFLLGVAHSGAQAPLSVDPTFVVPFYPDKVETSGFSQMFRLDDGNFLISGDFSYSTDWWNSHSCGVITSTGALVAPDFYGSAYGGGLKIEPWNGQIYMAASSGELRRFDQDGTWDPGFDMTHPGLNIAQAGEFAVQSDGSILYSGALDIDPTPGANALYGIAKYTNTGAVDTTYQHRLSNGNIYRLRPTGDGRYWCSGVLNEYDGQPVSRFFRIWPNGDLDTTFNSPIQAGQMSDVHTMPNGRLIIGGSFKLAGVADTLYLIRLMPDGALDSTFHNERHLEYYDPDILALIPYVRCILPLDESRLLIGGGFWTVDGERRGLLAVVDTAGNLDNDLGNYYGCDSVSGGPNNDREIGNVLWMDRLDDGNIYIGGVYTGFDDGVWHPEQRMITRLLPMNMGVAERRNPSALRTWPNPGAEVLNLDPGCLTCTYSVSVRDVLCQEAMHSQQAIGPSTLDVHHLAPGAYCIDITMSDGDRRTSNWIKR